MANPAFENAAKYAEELGFKVFPCVAGDKRPLLKHGFHEASSDAVQLAKWNKKWPDANWAVATGSESGVFVADIDSAEADAWWESLWIPEGAVVETPRGGRHIYYSYDGDGLDLGITNGTIHEKFDTRGNGGYVMLPGSWTSPSTNPSNGEGSYTGPLDGMIEVPQGLIDIIPEKQYFEALSPEAFEAISSQEKPSEASLPEQRVIKGLTDLLTALPRPWREGAGWHSTGFYVACQLFRISASPDYSLTEAEAYSLYKSNVPMRREDPADIWDIRWASAKKQTMGQVADPPGDTPIRLEVTDELLSRFADSEIDKLYWESTKIGEVKRLIRALRLKGATQQEAYSISYDSAAMKRIRQANRGSSSTWGYVLKEWDSPIPESSNEIDEEWNAPAQATKPANREVPLKILTDDERARIRDYPNFIDQYILAAKHLYSEPNLPLHYVNAWIALSVGIGDRAAIFEKKGRVPLSLWGFCAAPTAAGKSDAVYLKHAVVDGLRSGGWAGVDLGDDASAEQLTEVIMDRANRSTIMSVDECETVLGPAKQNLGSYQGKLLKTWLRLYDGRASRALRKGMDKDQIGEVADISFSLWLQTTWDGMIGILDEGDIESGFVGRFLVGIGDGAKITKESLTPEIASEYQVENGGRHPMIDSFSKVAGQMAASLPAGNRNRIDFAGPDVLERLVQMRLQVQAYRETHPLGEHLKGVFLRVTYNMLKGAALIAMSEGRLKVEMEDLLIAMKSGEYWIRDSIRMAEDISSSSYRRLVDHVVDLVRQRPRTNSFLLKSSKLSSLKMYEADEVIARAREEGQIVLANNRWEIVE